MPSDMRPLEELGVKIAAALGDGPSEAQLIFQRCDFLGHVKKYPRAARARWTLGIAAAAVMVAAVVGVVLRLNLLA